MSTRELKKQVWELIDKYSMDFSQHDYLDFLRGIRDDAGIRVEGVEEEIENA